MTKSKKSLNCLIVIVTPATKYLIRINTGGNFKSMKVLTGFLIFQYSFFFMNSPCIASIEPGWYERFRDAEKYKAVQAQIAKANRIIFVSEKGNLAVLIHVPKAGKMAVSEDQIRTMVSKEPKELLVVWIQNSNPTRRLVQDEYLPENLAVVRALERRTKPFIYGLGYKRIIFVSGSDGWRSGWLVISDTDHS